MIEKRIEDVRKEYAEEQLDAAWMNMTGVLVKLLLAAGPVDAEDTRRLTPAYRRLEEARNQSGLPPLEEVAGMVQLVWQ